MTNVSAEVTELFNNVLQALDRLYDEESLVVDTHALLFATGLALGDSDAGRAMADAATALAFVLCLRGSEVERNRAALVITQPVREMVAAAAESRGGTGGGAATRADLVAALRGAAARQRSIGNEDLATFSEAVAEAMTEE